jgi:hypothetical protein
MSPTLDRRRSDANIGQGLWENAMVILGKWSFAGIWFSGIHFSQGEP